MSANSNVWIVWMLTYDQGCYSSHSYDVIGVYKTAEAAMVAAARWYPFGGFSWRKVDDTQYQAGQSDGYNEGEFTITRMTVQERPRELAAEVTKEIESQKAWRCYKFVLFEPTMTEQEYAD